MKQEEIDIMMRKIDDKCKFPKNWNIFIENNIKEIRYIIKDTHNKECYCTNCHYTFYNSKVRINQEYICPSCHHTWWVLSIHEDSPHTIKSVCLVQKIDKQIITRVFEIDAWYSNSDKRMKSHIQEYCRIIPGKGVFLSGVVWFYMGVMYISHYSSYNVGWRKYDGIRYFSDFITYPYNKNQMLKGSKLQYAPIKEFTERFYGYNFIDACQFAGYESFELLWNMKLYNLSLSASKLNKKGSFYKRFGLSKDYLKFMQDNDINYRQLKLLKLFKIKDTKLLETFENENYRDVKFLYDNKILDEYLKVNKHTYYFHIAHNDIKKLKELKEFIPLHKLKNYTKGLKELNIYLDYLKMAKQLALNYKSKKDLFPRNLIARHDKLQTKIKIVEDMSTQFKAYIRYLELSKYTYSNDKYIIFPAPSIDSMKDEGEQQGNCVGYMYLDPYINKETEIFFVRKLQDVAKSFITLEYKNGCVVQKELPHHKRDFTDEQNAFIDKWLSYRNFIDQKEKYSTRNKLNSVQYNLKQLIA